MSIAVVMREVAERLASTPVGAGQPAYHHARTASEVEADRAFVLTLLGRSGTASTGLDPRVEYAVALELVLQPGDFDLFADMQRLADSTSTLCRRLEGDNSWAGGAIVLVGNTTFDVSDTAHVATTDLRLIVRE